MGMRTLQLDALSKALGLIAGGRIVRQNVIINMSALASRSSGGGELKRWDRCRFVVEARRYSGAVCLVLCEAALAGGGTGGVKARLGDVHTSGQR